MRDDLIAFLRAHGFDVDSSTLANGYGTEGRVYVLPDSYDITGVYELEVYCCMTVGGDIERYADDVFTALGSELSRWSPHSIDFVFGTPPIPGRTPVFEPADYALVAVNSGARFGEDDD
ncbi:MAG: hypothetical protein OXG44_17010 [Gammaproteobacteria bacterium]|nr:hypothetical protein [Gammaproteobacteria bacterium]